MDQKATADRLIATFFLCTFSFFSPPKLSAQIVVIQGSDQVSASRTTINNNFAYLDSVKAPKASPVFTTPVTFSGLGTGAVKVTGGTLGLVVGSASDCVKVDGSSAACGTGNGTVTSVGLAGTSNQITITGSSPITASGSWTASFPAGGVTLPGVTTFAAGSISSPSALWPTGVGKLGFYKLSDFELGFPDNAITFIDSGTPTRYVSIQPQNINIPQTIHSAADITWYNAAGPGSGNTVALLSDTNLLFGPFSGGALNTGIVRDNADGILNVANAGLTLQPLRVATQSPGDNTTKAATTAFVTAAIGASGGGTVTNIATTTPLGGGPITTTGTLTCSTCVVASSPGAGIAHFAGSTQTVTSSAIVNADITNSTIDLTTKVTGALPTANQAAAGLVRTCEIVVGGVSSTSTALANDDDTPVVCDNATGATLTITAVACYADAGSPTVTPIITGGGATTILSGACTCGTASYGTCTLNGTPTQTNGQTIDGNITSAGGTAKYIVMRIVRTL